MMTVPLPSTLDMAAASPLAASLRELLATGEPIRLDGGEVARVGQACLQVLMSARQSAIKAGTDFAIERPSEEFQASGALAGLGALFAPNA